ncbi:MAG: ATPase subunit of ABC transporter with duplicated ATPase domains [Psychrosphaera sp.]|jgi:ATPase subunit of ABC transporter with duplicated ATPase domains
MPILQAYNLSHQFENGDRLFEQLSCSMVKNRIGLVGRNGVGKSILASLLSGEQKPHSGIITLPKSLLMYRQQPCHLLSGDFTIAQYLGIDDVLEALNRVESGDCSESLFDVIGENWDLLSKLIQQLKAIGLPPDADFPCAKLSGGELARLQLWKMFESDVELLILDEPSNHLDVQARLWLLESMRTFKGAILLISHDRVLLREMEEIWELSGHGIKVYGGNYDVYTEQKCIELHAVERQLASVIKQKKKLDVQTQINREKAEQRAAQGNKLRKEGSHGKSLLDSKKDNATARASNRNKNDLLRQAHLQEKEGRLKAKKEQLNRQKLYLDDSPSRVGKVVSIIEGVLPFGRDKPISLQVYANEKIYLTGRNGSGKSTLLKTLLGDYSLQQGELQLNTPLYYLDQHFSVIRTDLSILDNLLFQCNCIKESDARTLLAGIGFRRDSVFRIGSTLSGGEKMKLAMLIASHQPEKPFLLLDEPDNHLDLESKMMLAIALYNYRNGLILISHDHDFANESGVQREVTL